MKQYLLIILALLSLESSFAQNRKKEDFSAQMLEAKSLKMKESMGLSDEKYAKFLPIFKEYDTEINALIKSGKPVMQYTKAIEQNVDSEIAQSIITTQFDNSENLLNLKRKYLSKLSEILSGTELIKFYQTEANIRNKIKKEFNNREKQE